MQAAHQHLRQHPPLALGPLLGLAPALPLPLPLGPECTLVQQPPRALGLPTPACLLTLAQVGHNTNEAIILLKPYYY